MNIRFACPQCGCTLQKELLPGGNVHCEPCGLGWVVSDAALQGNAVRCCVVCSSRELFLRKDFPQLLGLSIVIGGLSLSCVTWYFYRLWETFALLFASALADVVLYALVGNVLTCYRCYAEYRSVSQSEHTAFDLEVHERHRQQAARLKDHQHEPESGDDRSRPTGIA